MHAGLESSAKDCSYYIFSLAVLATFTYNQIIEAWEAGPDTCGRDLFRHGGLMGVVHL